MSALSPAQLKEIYTAFHDGATDIREVAEATGLGEEAVELGIERLIKAGLVKVANMEELRYDVVVENPHCDVAA